MAQYTTADLPPPYRNDEIVTEEDSWRVAVENLLIKELRKQDPIILGGLGGLSLKAFNNKLNDTFGLSHCTLVLPRSAGFSFAFDGVPGYRIKFEYQAMDLEIYTCFIAKIKK